MMRVRLREPHADLAGFYMDRYPVGYQHREWPDHVERVRESVEFIWRSMDTETMSLADLSCGDNAIMTGVIDMVRRYVPGWSPDKTTGDVNPDSGAMITGALPGTLDLLTVPADLYLCSETLEHLDDPDGFLAKLRPVARSLFVSTPEGETGAENMEHYWGWDSEAVEDMLTSAGWSPISHQIFAPASVDYYRFQMWMCR
jgi:hypothetical protein